MNPEPGDLIRYNFYDDSPSPSGLVLEVLNIHDFWSKGLGRYPDHVFRVLTTSGEVAVWDFFNEPGTEPELEIILKLKTYENTLF